VDPEVGAEVAALAAAVRATPLERWTAADPYLALLVHRAGRASGVAFRFAEPSWAGWPLAA